MTPAEELVQFALGLREPIRLVLGLLAFVLGGASVAVFK